MARDFSETFFFVTLLAEQGYEGNILNMWALHNFRAQHCHLTK